MSTQVTRTPRSRDGNAGKLVIRIRLRHKALGCLLVIPMLQTRYITILLFVPIRSHHLMILRLIVFLKILAAPFIMTMIMAPKEHLFSAYCSMYAMCNVFKNYSKKTVVEELIILGGIEIFFTCRYLYVSFLINESTIYL